MQADDSQKIAQLKKYLRRKFPVLKGDSFRIKYKNCVLSNSQTLRSIGIQNSSILHVVTYDTAKPVRITAIRKEAGVSTDESTESKQSNSGTDSVTTSIKQITLNADYTDTISDLIDRISKELNCNGSDLILKYNNRFLDESSSIVDCGIKSNEILDIINIHEEIRIHHIDDNYNLRIRTRKLDIRHPNGAIIEFKYDANCFIEDLKKMIEKICSVNDKNQMILMYNGIRLSNDLMIADYNIKPESVLRLGFNCNFGGDNMKNANQNSASNEKELRIIVHTLTGRMIMLEIGSNDTVEKLKNKIFESQNVKVEQQCLLYGRKQLKNDFDCLSAYGIKDESSVIMVLNVAGYGGVEAIFHSIVGARGGNGMCGVGDLCVILELVK